MIDPKQIPDEVVEAHIAILEKMMIGPPTRNSSRAAIAAAINAWPGNTVESREVLNFGNNIDGAVVSAKRVPFLILPLPQKGGDA